MKSHGCPGGGGQVRDDLTPRQRATSTTSEAGVKGKTRGGKRNGEREREREGEREKEREREKEKEKEKKKEKEKEKEKRERERASERAREGGRERREKREERERESERGSERASEGGREGEKRGREPRGNRVAREPQVQDTHRHPTRTHTQSGFCQNFRPKSFARLAHTLPPRDRMTPELTLSAFVLVLQVLLQDEEPCRYSCKMRSQRRAVWRAWAQLLERWGWSRTWPYGSGRPRSAFWSGKAAGTCRTGTASAWRCSPK